MNKIKKKLAIGGLLALFTLGSAGCTDDFRGTKSLFPFPEKTNAWRTKESPSAEEKDSFWRTEFIEKNAHEIIERRENIIEKYKKECGIEIYKNPERKEESLLVINPDNTHTLFYRVEFVNINEVENIIKEQIKEAIVSKSLEIDKLIITLPDDSKIGSLEKILAETDIKSAQVLLEYSLKTEYGDWTQDFAAYFDIAFGNLNDVFGSVKSQFPGAAARVKGREDIGAVYGLKTNTSSVNIKATLDFLESKGFVKQRYKTSILLSNKKKGSLSEEEKLPIPAYIITGNQTVQTFDLEPIRSFFEATPEKIYENGLIELSFKAGMGSSKRPEGPLQYPIPVKEEIEMNGISLRIGEPFIVAGKANELEVGVRRKDPIFPWLFGSKDYEKRTVRTWYELTPYRVIYYEEDKPRKIIDKIIDLRKTTTQPTTNPSTK